MHASLNPNPWRVPCQGLPLIICWCLQPLLLLLSMWALCSSWMSFFCLLCCDFSQNGTQNHVCKIDIPRSIYKKKAQTLSESMAWKSIPLSSGLAETVLTFLQRLLIPWQRKMPNSLKNYEPNMPKTVKWKCLTMPHNKHKDQLHVYETTYYCLTSNMETSEF
jgi:hypothetical protein